MIKLRIRNKGLLIFCLLLSYPSHPLFAQSNDSTSIPRTEFGFPDFQGNWQHLTQTPLRRPVELGNRQAYSEEEVRTMLVEIQENLDKRNAPLNPNRGAPTEGVVTNQADDNFDEFPTSIAYINGEYRTSLIIDPPDGQLPLREEIVGSRAWSALRQRPGQYEEPGYQPSGDEFWSSLWQTETLFDGPEAAWAAERCLIVGPQLSMMYPRGLSPYNQIVQTKDYLVILGEYPYDARIIRIDGTHREPQFPRWMGDSVAHWEDDTLVINTRGFRSEQSFPPILSSQELEIEERLTLIDGDGLLYRYTVEDPVVYTRPVIAEVPFTRMAEGQVLYEYACHEGNYSFVNTLRGARIEELLDN